MEFKLTQGRALLERTPRTLRALLQGLPDALTRSNEGPGTWSPHEVLAHLIHGERTDWIPRARLILGGDPRMTFAPFDREGFFADARAMTLAEVLDVFERERSASLRTLDGWKLGERELALVAQHPALGPVTMRQLLATWVVHDLTHVVQISRTMAHQYREAVGPWVEFLGVLKTAPPG